MYVTGSRNGRQREGIGGRTWGGALSRESHGLDVYITCSIEPVAKVAHYKILDCIAKPIVTHL